MEDRADRVMHYNPARYTGRHLYFKRLRQASEISRCQGRPVPANLSQMVIRGGSRLWRRLDFGTQHRFHAESVDEAACVARHRAENGASLRVSAALLRQRASDAMASRALPCCRLSACRLSEVERTEFDEHVANGRWSRRHVAELRELKREPLGGVDDRWKACLAQIEIDEPRRPRLPAWVRTLCRHRAFFLECVLQFVPSTGNEPFFLAVFYASLNPVAAGFLRVHEREAVERRLGGSGWPTQSLDQWEHNYEAQGFDFMFSDEDWAQGEFRIYVLDACCRREGWRWCSDMRWETWGFYAQRFWDPAEGAEDDGDSEPEVAKCVPASWADDAARLDFWAWPDAAADVVAQEAARRLAPMAGEAREEDEDEEVREALEDSLLDAFYEMRHELHEAGVGFEHEGFYIAPRGGPATLSRTGWRPTPFAQLRALGRPWLCAKLCICLTLRHSATISTGRPWRRSSPRCGRANCRTSACAVWLLAQARGASSTGQLLQPLGSSHRRWRRSLSVGTGRRNDALGTCVACRLCKPLEWHTLWSANVRAVV